MFFIHYLETGSLKKAIMAAKLLHSRYIVIHCARPYDWNVDPEPERTRELNYKIFSELLPVARECGVKIALEKMPCIGIPTSMPEELCGYIDMMGDSQNFVACLDTGHANITRIDCREYARILGRRLKVLHIHDNKGETDDHACPYLGTINWDSFMNALKDIGYSGTFSLETMKFVHCFPKEMFIQAKTYTYNVAKYLCDKYSL
jgi:sugar phosphate isomerase/epimerase